MSAPALPALLERPNTPDPRLYCMSPDPYPTRRLAWTPSEDEITIRVPSRTPTPNSTPSPTESKTFGFKFPCKDCNVVHDISFKAIDITKRHFYFTSNNKACKKSYDMGKMLLKTMLRFSNMPVDSE